MRLLVRSIVVALALAFVSAGTRASDPIADPIAEATRAMERGVDASVRGDHEQALACYRSAAALVPTANLPHRYAGDALVALGRNEEAVRAYESYLRIKPDVSDGPAVRARVQALYEESVHGAK